MRRDGRRAIAVTAAVTAAVGIGAATSAGQPRAARENAHSGPRPVASLRPRHAEVVVGRKVLLDSSGSRAREGRIAYHLWDLNGDGVYDYSSGRHARIRHVFKRAGVVRIAVAVFDTRGGHSVRHARVRAVNAPAAAATASSTGGSLAARSATSRAGARSKGSHGGHAAAAHRAKAASGESPDNAPLAAASSGSVTIQNFAFHPGSMTVNVGDTVTWSNSDQVSHSATANDGSFDTGLITHGSTAQYRFTKAGTFSYHCSPHPYMKGTIVVKAASAGNSSSTGGSSPSGSSSGGSGGSGGSSGGSSHSSSLPHTGLEIGALVLVGLLMLGTGTFLRRRLASR